MTGIDVQSNTESSASATPISPDGARRWAKTSLIAGVASWASFIIAFLLPFLVMPLIMRSAAASANSSGSASAPASAQAAIFISTVATVGYPIGMALGVIGLVAGVVALRKVGPDQSAVRSKNMALAGASLGGVSLIPTCFLLFGVGIWGALAIVMNTSGR